MILSNHFLYLPGGVDINPKRYGQEALSYTQTPNDWRDRVEFEAVELAMQRGTPIIGICRGAQLLCIANGGSLYQHSQPLSHNHSIQVIDGMSHHTFSSVSAGHHQVMKPEGNCIIYGRNPEVVKVWTGEDETHLIVGTAEIVWWPKTKSLAIQPHPEWEVGETHFIQWLNRLVDKLDIKYKF